MNSSEKFSHWGIFARYAISVCNKNYPIAAAFALTFG